MAKPDSFDSELSRQKIAESRAQTEKLRVETEYIRTQKQFYPYVVGSGVIAALIAFLKLVS